MINRKQKEALLRVADAIDALRDAGMSICADGAGEISFGYFDDSVEAPEGLRGVQIRELVCDLIPKGVH
jgi:hypothetical protein